MTEGHEADVDDLGEEDISESGSMVRKVSSPRSSNQGDIRSIFRPFNMNAMENVRSVKQKPDRPFHHFGD